MHQMVVPTAQQHEVLVVGEAHVAPVDDVVGLAMLDGSVATREPAPA
ncbi:MAG: hypothetical protein RI900_2187, partial [Actinomycetota bacterium]